MSNIKYSIKDNTITSFGSYTGLLKDIEACKERTFKHSVNKEHIQNYSSNKDISHEEFAGGKWEDVTNLRNMDAFKKQLQEFKKHRLEEKIIAKLDFNPKRKRALSEHDGDYDHDKRWEIKPFNNSRKEMLPISVVDINVDMSISCGMSADAINKYGTLVWSIVQLIESLGIQASVKVVNDSVNMTRAGNYEAKLTLEIKKAGEYMSPVSLATCFQSVFYRRVIFSAIVMQAEESGNEVAYGLGRPRVPDEKEFVYFKNGAIYTRAGGSFNEKEIEKAIIEMVTKR